MIIYISVADNTKVRAVAESKLVTEFKVTEEIIMINVWSGLVIVFSNYTFIVMYVICTDSSRMNLS